MYDARKAARDLGTAQAIIANLIMEMRTPLVKDGYRDDLIERAEKFLKMRKRITSGDA